METATLESTNQAPLLETSSPAKAEILPLAFYEIAQLTDKDSPYYLVSSASLFRALKSGALTACRAGRRTLLKGADIHRWLSGEAETV